MPTTAGASRSVSLIRHEAAAAPAVSSISVRVQESPPQTLALHYTLEGDLARLVIPARAAPRRADELWRHSCFEAFLADPQHSGYFELNVAPSRQWALYRFSAYREGMTPTDCRPPPRIEVRRAARRLEVDVSLALQDFVTEGAARAARLALAAVIEDTQGRLSYWALRHPSGAPDFHHPDSFAYSL